MTQEVVDGFAGLDRVLMEVLSDHHKMDYTECLENFLPVLQSQHAAGFDGRSSPDGEPWPELSPVTIKRKGHDIPLVDKLRLKPSVLELDHPDHVGGVTNRGLLFGTSVDYGFYHQFGTSRIPQREFVGMSEASLEVLTNAVADAEVRGLTYSL